MRTIRPMLAAALAVVMVCPSACGDDGDAVPPATDPPTTQPPPTDPPPTEPPATDPPATEPPATEPPTTEPPATDPPATEPPATDPPATEPPATEPPSTQVDVRVYFLRDVQLVIEHRDVAGPAVLRAALEALMAGPTAAETTAGVFTIVPDGTRLLDVRLDSGIATVDLSSQFESGGGTMSMQARVGQVVFTATQFPNVDAVRFWLDGAPIDYLGGEGLVMTEPWRRMDVEWELTGGVLVDTPYPDDTVTSPFQVTGEGDVYEADFPIEIWRGDDLLTVVAPVQAGAWGEWADFQTTVTVDAPPGPIELVAYDAGGCGDDPECPPIVKTIVPLTLAG